MSSHHIVKEFQEPALYFDSVDLINFDDVSGLLEWSPFIIANDGSYEKLLSWGIKIDLLISHVEGENLQFKVLTSDNKESNLKSALSYLVEHQHTAVNIVTSQSFSELRSAIEYNVVYLKSLSMTCFDKGNVYFYIEGKKFVKWYPKLTNVKILYQSNVYVVGSVNRSEHEKYLHLEIIEDGNLEIQSANGFWVVENIK